jgi:hypothetical protein
VGSSNVLLDIWSYIYIYICIYSIDAPTGSRFCLLLGARDEGSNGCYVYEALDGASSYDWLPACM